MQRKYVGPLVIIGIAALLFGASPAGAQISLGTAQSFSVLGGSGVTNTGPSAIAGNVGAFPSSSVTGFPPGIVAGGTIHAGNATAGQAQSDLTTAYNAVAGTACNVDLTGQNLGGLTLTPGVYCFSSSAFLTGTLTLDMQGNANALFLFKIGSTLITASGSTVVLINSGATTCPPNVYWQVGSSATLGTGSTFAGNILALTSISLTTGARLNGRALARNGAVTLDNNTVAICAPAVVCPIITVAPTTLPDGQVGTAYLATVSASGGVGPYTFAVTSGALPTGLLLDGSTGSISGTPTTVGTYNFTITATDASTGCFGSRAYTVVIAAAGCPVITLGPPTLPSGVVGAQYGAIITASGIAPMTFAVTSGALPTGLTLNPATGAITGTPTLEGVFNFTVESTDARLCTGVRPFSIVIAAAPGGVPAVGFVGLSILVVLLAGAGLFAMNRFSI